MLRNTQISIPTLVRVKEGALDRLGIYLSRSNHRRVAGFVSKRLQAPLPERTSASLRSQNIEPVNWQEITDNDLESTAKLFAEIPSTATAIIGVGGGKALDVAKYVAFLGRLPYFAVPTSLSNDGFCSPQSSLTVRGKRRSLPASLPFGVVIDTMVCLNAPRILILSGVGDLVAKFTAVRDWKLAFHHNGEAVDDFAALLSDGSIHSFLSHSQFDVEGTRLLATSLLLNGIAMEICGSSRPASGSEHLISHALDAISTRPRLHGLQVGVATYLVSKLQGINSERIASLFNATGFWNAIAEDPVYENFEVEHQIENVSVIFVIGSTADSRKDLNHANRRSTSRSYRIRIYCFGKATERISKPINQGLPRTSAATRTLRQCVQHLTRHLASAA